jgi:hypothetical protein
VTRLRQAARQFLAPVGPDTFFANVDPIGRSLAADLDDEPPLEIVVAMRDVPTLVSLGMLRVGSPAGFEIVEAGVEAGVESPRNIRAIAFGRAFPESTSGREAVFLVHETIVDGAAERRLSTRLVDGAVETLRLLPPDIGAQPGYAIDSVVAGNFHQQSAASGGEARDLALARTVNGSGAIELVRNDGSGGVPDASISRSVPALLPSSMTLLPAAPNEIDSLAACSRDSRLAVWLPGEGFAETTPLRAAIADPLLATIDLADSTRVERGDVDGDGLDDLVVLLSFDLAAPGEGQAAIALLRGQPRLPPPNAVPRFHVPEVTTLVHGRASAIALGDFTRNGPGAPRRLELAVAVPKGAAGGPDGNHVRFFRYEPGSTPAGDRFVPAAAANGPQVLLAGSEPTRLAAADFDRDGSSDLLVACSGDGTLRLYRNTSLVAPGATAVAVGAFAEALGSPWQLGPGKPTLLRLSDVNGDGSLDAVTWVEDVSAGVRSTSVAVYLSSGAGAFDGPRPMSPTRIGNRNGRLSGDLGDWNRDGVPDAFLGWNTQLPGGDINLRVLFGGTR